MKFIATTLLCFAAWFLQAQDEEPNSSPKRTRELSVPLFNGKDFSGFTFFMLGNADPLKTWSVNNGVIHCTGKPAGYLRTTQIVSNYFLTVEWRFVKIAPNADNTGILVHIQSPDKVWPQSIEVQGKSERQGDLFFIGGADSKEHKGLTANIPLLKRGDLVERPVEKPIGEWNKAEVICLHGKVECFINGKFMNEATECTLDAGYIGIQSKGAEIEIRSIIFSPLKY